MRRQRKSPSFDKTLFILTIILTIAGIIAVADASSPQALTVFNDPLYFAKQQTIWAIIGFLLMLTTIVLPYKLWKRTAKLFFGISLLLLILVLIPKVGTRSLGAQRWISFGFFSLQPSEVAKLALIISFAYLSDLSAKLRHYLTALGIFVILIILQPDFGTSIVLVGVAFVQMFVANLPILKLFYISIAGSLSGFLLVIFSGYRKQRLLTFLENSDIRQILIAIGSGGILGIGLGQSRQKHLFLPETATDSVFAVIAEETGFLGSLILIAFLAYFTLRALKIAGKAPDQFSKILATGIATWIGGQTFLNLASMTALIPLTGIPLPFFSYGGSSLVMILISTGILLNISRYAKKES